MINLFCFGFGFTASLLARQLAGLDCAVTGTSTNATGAQRIKAGGATGLLFDGTKPGAGVDQALATATHVLLSIPPDKDGDPAFIHHGAAIAESPSIRWIGYLSTVGVYGDHHGGPVDETTPPAPISERGARRLAAEQAWLELGRRSGKQVQVFRLPGIYGPGRSALDSVRAGTARRIVKPGQVFNRIHADDIAGALALAMSGRGRHEVYNISDEEPCPPQDVITHAAKLLGVAPPPEVAFAEAKLSPMAASFYGESKRVSNARAKADLGWTPRYPNYREGLAAILASGH